MAPGSTEFKEDLKNIMNGVAKGGGAERAKKQRKCGELYKCCSVVLSPIPFFLEAIASRLEVLVARSY